MAFPPPPEPATALGRHRVLSPTCGLRVSPLALGAMSVGSAWKDFMGSMDKKSSFELLDAFYEAGGNFIGEPIYCSAKADGIDISYGYQIPPTITR